MTHVGDVTAVVPAGAQRAALVVAVVWIVAGVALLRRTRRGGAGPVVARWPVPVLAAVAVVPVVVAAVVVAVVPSQGHPGGPVTVALTADHCVEGWHGGRAGTRTFAVTDRSGRPGEVDLDNATGRIVADIVDIGPATTVHMTATLGAGRYGFACYLLGEPVTASPEVVVTGTSPTPPTFAVAPVSTEDLAPPVAAYEAYAATGLGTLAHAVAAIGAELRAGDLAAARAGWLVAQQDWERVGASYDSFGPLGQAVDGLPGGLPAGVADPNFTGLHRLEYGLWHGQGAATLVPVTVRLASAVASLRAHLDDPDLAGDPANLPIRAHEIIEDAVRDHLSGLDDEGAGAAMAETYADEQADARVLGELRMLIVRREPALVTTLDADGRRLDAALLATRTATGAWVPVSTVPVARREAVDAAVGTLLQDLSAVPTLLKIGIGA